MTDSRQKQNRKQGIQVDYKFVLLKLISPIRSKDLIKITKCTESELTQKDCQKMNTFIAFKQQFYQ